VPIVHWQEIFAIAIILYRIASNSNWQDITSKRDFSSEETPRIIYKDRASIMTNLAFWISNCGARTALDAGRSYRVGLENVHVPPVIAGQRLAFGAAKNTLPSSQ
jgi:hypothetical protein